MRYTAFEEFYITIKTISGAMLASRKTSEIKWIVLALMIALVLVGTINASFLFGTGVDGAGQTFLGLNLFMEILVFFVFSTFVVFGIKGFFEMYSQKTANLIIFSTGVAMTVAIFVLTCQILF